MIRKLLSYLLTAPLLLAAACISEEVVECPDTDGNMVLSLKLDMGLDAKASRADNDPDDYEDYSGDFERISSLRVIILRDSTEIEGAKLVATNPEGEPINDNLDFIVKSNETKTIILIANEDALPAPKGSGTAKDYLDQFLKKGLKIDKEKWEQLNDWQVSMPAQITTNGNTSTRGLFSNPNDRLPLTERFTFYVSSNSPNKEPSIAPDGKDKQEVTLFLTRAAAKATFRFYVGEPPTNIPIDQIPDGYSGDKNFKGIGMFVTGIRLNGLDWTEYVLPKNTSYYPAKYETVDGIEIPKLVETAERYITSFTPVPNAQKFNYTLNLNEPAEIKYNDPLLNSTYGSIYFPESMCDAGEHYTVQVRIASKDNNGNLIYGDDDGWITAKDGGILRNNILDIKDNDAIARNTHLKILIFFGETGITASAIVAPYNTVKLEPLFGLKTKQ